MKTWNKIKKNANTIRCFIMCGLFPKKYLPIKASMFFSKGNVKPFNWGDDMNYYLTNLMSKKKFLHIQESKMLKLCSIDSYLIVGSTITFYSLDHVTIWGAGIINDHESDRISGEPKKICAVRGPLTRDILIRRGYNCPDIYGDPILLLPMFYTPKVKGEKHRIGLVPHFTDKNLPIIQEINSKDIHIIDVQNYGQWDDFVDQICSCRYIVSSSLHGLICAEAYGIPSIWVGFSDYIDGWEFKFLDYYMSINKPNTTMEMVKEKGDIERLVSTKLKNWHPGEIDLSRLLEACPFDITIQES